MAANLSLEVIAEGVETEEQLKFLHDHGCRIYQGYVVARPLPQDRFVRMWEQGLHASLESTER